MPIERIIHGERDGIDHWTAWFLDTPGDHAIGQSAKEALAQIMAVGEPRIELQELWPRSKRFCAGPDEFEIAFVLEDLTRTGSMERQTREVWR